MSPAASPNNFDGGQFEILQRFFGPAMTIASVPSGTGFFAGEIEVSTVVALLVRDDTMLVMSVSPVPAVVASPWPVRNSTCVFAGV